MKYILTIAIALTMYLPAPVQAAPSWKSWICDAPWVKGPDHGLRKWCDTGLAWERNSG